VVVVVVVVVVVQVQTFLQHTKRTAILLAKLYNKILFSCPDNGEIKQGTDFKPP
jgi:hypothetical protein